MAEQAKSKIVVKEKMSNEDWDLNGRPNWWCMISRPKGEEAEWVRFGKIPANRELDVEVDVPVGTKLFLGAGKETGKIRVNVVTIDVAEVPNDTNPVSEPDETLSIPF